MFSPKVVGWGVSSTMRALGVPLTALKQALFEARRAGSDPAQIVDHSDCGWQYVSADYTADVKEFGVQLSVGSRGDSYDNCFG